ncbi:ankyrin repeat-containing protein ITN1-like [Zingiber officinale]|uniref:ankyrin repeat-containing protein ITN1-like n=1 Tax=Zingiber officinale TaxID=94328 RepID=UPI001C4DCB91|nr:ankyrin repeat-containing protein ITN1-like [Zingiber officinale]
MVPQHEEGEKEIELESSSVNSSSLTTAPPPVPALVLSNSGKRIDHAASATGSPTGFPVLVLSSSGKRMDQASSSAASPTTAPALVLSNSGKRVDPVGKKKYVKQVTGRHNDTEIHLAAHRGDLAAVRQILREIDAQITGEEGAAEFDAEVAEIRAAMVNEVNEVEETALFIAAEKGFLDIVVELLKYSDRESLSRKNRVGFDALHVAVREGKQGILGTIS